MPYLYILMAAVFSTIGNLLLKNSRLQLTDYSTLLEQYLNISFMSAIFFYALNVFIFAKALDTLPVSVGYPILASLGFTFLAISSSFFFGEKLQVIQFIGILLIAFGIFLLSSNANS